MISSRISFFILFLAFVLGGIVLTAPYSFAQAATFSVSPASGTFSVGDTITATIHLDTAGAAIDGADVAYLTYNPSLLQVIDENLGIAGVQIMPGLLMTVNPANGNSVDTTLGRIRFSQVASGGTTFTSVGTQTLATVRFTVLAQGTATLLFISAPGSTADSNVAGSNGMDFLTSTSGASYSLIISTKFQINDRVQVSSGPLNVRSCAGTACSLLDTQATGALGTVIGGPTFADGSWWWNINYDSGMDGWSIEDFLIIYVAPFDFSLQNEGNKTVGQSQLVTNLITAMLGQGTPQIVSFSTAGLPAGASDSYTPPDCTPDCSSTLTINSGTAAIGTYTITVTGSNGALSHITSFLLTVSDLTPPIISNVQKINITTNSATITWNTNELADSRVDYGLTPTLGSFVSSPAFEMSHSLPLSGLSSDATYYYQVSSKDAAGNGPTVFTIDQFRTLPIVTPDTTSPAKIVNLRATAVRKFSADLAWTAPGDDDNVGTAASYDIRYATFPLTDSTWGNAIQATGEPIPTVSGSPQTYKLVTLKRETTYWVGIKTSDEAVPPNTSLLSNVISFKTPKGGSAQLDSSLLFAAPLLAQGTEETEDTTPPGDVMQFQAKGVNAQIILFWKNPHDSDYVRTLIVKKAGTAAPTSPQDGIKIYEGTNEMFTDINLTNGMSYSYTAFTFDETPNYSKGVSVTVSPNQNVTSTSRSSMPPPSILSHGLFTRLLARGIKDSDVRQLQQFLMSQGYLASGNDTGYFGALTEQALKDFQCKKGIVCNGTAKTTGWGVFGPKTRSLANQLFGQNTTTPASLTREQQQQLINSLTQQVNTLMQQLQKLLSN